MGKFTNRSENVSKASPLSFTTSEGLELTYLDGDTWSDSSGERYRLGGVNLEETAKVIKEDGQKTIKQGQLGGKAALQAMYELQRRGRFNILEDTGEVDEYGRKVVNFKNDRGEDLSQQAIGSRIAEVNKYTTDEALTVLSELELEEELLGTKGEYADIAEELKGKRTPPVFKAKAINEAQYASNPDAYDGVEFRKGGRTIDNKSLNPWSDSWESGWLGVKEGLYGFTELIGEASGIDWLDSIGEAGVARAQKQLKDKPELILDYKQVDNVWDGFSFVANNTIMSAPYLALGIGAALTAPVSLVGATAATAISATPLTATYIGQFWNEMEGERGGTQMVGAILGGTAAGALDRLGISAIIRPGEVLTKTGRNRAIKALRDKIYGASLKSGNKISLSQADKLAKERFNSASREAIVSTINQLGRITSSDIAKFSGVNIAKAGARGLVGESLTEIGQEGLQAATVAGVSDTTYTQGEVLDRLLNAGLAGGTAGGTLATAGGIKTEVGQELLRRDLSLDKNKLTALDELRESDTENGLSPKSVKDVNAETRQKRKSKVKDVTDELSTTTSLSSKHQKERRGLKNIFGNIQSVTDGFNTVWEGINRFHRASIETAIPTSLAVSSAALRKLKAKIGNGVVGGTYYSGRSEIAYRDSLLADFESHVSPNDLIINVLQTGKSDSEKNQQIASDTILDFVNSKSIQEVINAANEGRDVDLNNIEDRHKGELAKLSVAVSKIEAGYRSMLEALNETSIKQTGKELDPEVAKQYLQWQKLKTPDRKIIKKNHKAFKQFLKGTKLMTDGEIDAAIDKIIGGEINESDGSIFSTDYKPWSSKLQQALREPGGEKFASTNVFETYDNMKEATAKYVSNAEYYGENGADVDQLLEEAREEGVDEDTLAHVAWHAKNIIDSSNGTYNKITNPRIAGLVKMATTWSAFVGLGLSAVSSIPETALIMENLENSQEGRKAIQALAKEFGSMFKGGLEKHYKQYYKKSRGQEILDTAGFPLSTTTAQRRIGVGSTSPAMQRWLNNYFKYIGIQNITAWQRRANASFAVDYIQNRLESLSFIPIKKDGKLDLKQANRRQQNQYNELANLGMDVDKLVDLFNASGKAIDPVIDGANRAALDLKLQLKTGSQEALADLDDQLQTGIYAFVNQRVQNPQFANRPLIFQDPTLQLFTQFNGFISTFTAQALPRIYGNRLLRGTPNIRANTAAMIILMIGLGGASQYLKDLLKFGEASPYIGGGDPFSWRNVQRSIYASGVLGQGERIADTLLPLYPQREDGLDKVWNTIVGEAGPTVRNVSTILEGLGNVGEGNVERATDKALKLTPLIAPLTGTRKKINEILHEGFI